MWKWYAEILCLLLWGCNFAFAQKRTSARTDFFFNSAGFAIETYGSGGSSSWLRSNGVNTPRRLYGGSAELMTGKNKMAYGIEGTLVGAASSSATFISGAMGFVIGRPIKTHQFGVVPQLSTGWYLSIVDFSLNVPSLISTTYPGAKQDDMHSFSWYFNPHVDLIKPFGIDDPRPGVGLTIGYYVSVLSSKWGYSMGAGGGKIDFIPKPLIGCPYIAINLTTSGW
jgi:hypothetical protein